MIRNADDRCGYTCHLPGMLPSPCAQGRVSPEWRKGVRLLLGDASASPAFCTKHVWASRIRSFFTPEVGASPGYPIPGSTPESTQPPLFGDASLSRSVREGASRLPFSEQEAIIAMVWSTIDSNHAPASAIQHRIESCSQSLPFKAHTPGTRINARYMPGYTEGWVGQACKFPRALLNFRSASNALAPVSWVHNPIGAGAARISRGRTTLLDH